jgi:hypothetical protein
MRKSTLFQTVSLFSLLLCFGASGASATVSSQERAGWAIDQAYTELENVRLGTSTSCDKVIYYSNYAVNAYNDESGGLETMADRAITECAQLVEASNQEANTDEADTEEASNNEADTNEASADEKLAAALMAEAKKLLLEAKQNQNKLCLRRTLKESDTTSTTEKSPVPKPSGPSEPEPTSINSPPYPPYCELIRGKVNEAVQLTTSYKDSYKKSGDTMISNCKGLMQACKDGVDEEAEAQRLFEVVNGEMTLVEQGTSKTCDAVKSNLKAIYMLSQDMAKKYIATGNSITARCETLIAKYQKPVAESNINIYDKVANAHYRNALKALENKDCAGVKTHMDKAYKTMSKKRGVTQSELKSWKAMGAKMQTICATSKADCSSGVCKMTGESMSTTSAATTKSATSATTTKSATSTSSSKKATSSSQSGSSKKKSSASNSTSSRYEIRMKDGSPLPDGSEIPRKTPVKTMKPTTSNGSKYTIKKETTVGRSYSPSVDCGKSGRVTCSVPGQ